MPSLIGSLGTAIKAVQKKILGPLLSFILRNKTGFDFYADPFIIYFYVKFVLKKVNELHVRRFEVYKDQLKEKS